MLFCTSCGVQQAGQAAFCSSCGKANSAPPIQPGAVNPSAGASTSSQKNGLGITSIVLSSLALFFGLSDLGNIQNGTYAYVYSSEVGLLFMGDIAGLVLGLVSFKSKSNIGRIALIITGISFFVTFSLARYMA